MSPSATFQGFSRDALQFLVDLALNNDRAWFQPRKAEYDRLLKEPLEALIADLAAELDEAQGSARGGPQEVAVPHLPRRALLKGQVALQDARRGQLPVGGPAATPTSEGESERHGGGYFHLSPEGTYMGGGMWHPGAGSTGCVPTSRRQGHEPDAEGAQRAEVPQAVRAGPRRFAEARPHRLRAGSSRRPSCSSSRT